jgi:polysaccharide pyruvyl transferase WcaK-like protein
MLSDIVLLGYYGRGNFGDDVLMVVSHALALQMLPGAQVAVRVGTPSAYLERLLGSDTAWLPFGTREQHRLVIHGGGGTFFDFDDHGTLARVYNSLLFAGGARAFVGCESMLRKLAGRPRLAARTRIGLGLGVGTFTPGSARLREALPVLADFDALWLRDADSLNNLASLGVNPPVVRGSDLAFLWEHWCPPALAMAPMTARVLRPRVGVVLRDWPGDSGATFARSFLPVLTHLAADYELTLISLDPATDAGTLAALAHLPQLVWTPESMGIPEFAARLASQDVLLTSRAHGAICGACIGRASVILGIEPKLWAVNAMLPNATRLVTSPYEPRTVAARIDEALAIPIDCIAADVQNNRAASLQALADVLQRVNP